MTFRDLKAQYHALEADIDKSIKEVLNSSAFILGKPVQELEKELADYVGVEHCVSCGNGTDALQLVLMAWGIGKGDAVFTSDFTYFASAGAASVLGASPVLVDIDLNTFNMDPADLERKIIKTLGEGKLVPKVIIPVDLFGQPAQHHEIQDIADKYGMKVLEDGAQGFGGTIKGRRACSFGDAATTSFFPAKPLGCYGDGGAVFTNNDDLAETLQSLRAQGRSSEDKYDNRAIGINSRLDTLQAAILKVKLNAFKRYELINVNKAAEMYTERLKEIVKTPVVLSGHISSWAQYTIRLENREQRDVVQKALKEKDIPSMIYYPRAIHRQTAYADFGFKDEDYKNTMEAVETVLSLPMHPYLEEKDIEYISQNLKEAVKK
ncbi:MAG: DegT/DnrJ/EryC1/StrS family aminotransferase [Anaerovoracaceae bacterium]